MQVLKMGINWWLSSTLVIHASQKLNMGTSFCPFAKWRTGKFTNNFNLVFFFTELLLGLSNIQPKSLLGFSLYLKGMLLGHMYLHWISLIHYPYLQTVDLSIDISFQISTYIVFIVAYAFPFEQDVLFHLRTRKASFDDIEIVSIWVI